MISKSLSVAVLFAVAPAYAAEAVKNPDWFIYLLQSAPQTSDPVLSQDSMSSLILANVYEPLLGYQFGGPHGPDIVPRLAATVPTRANGLISADGLTYRFPIRQGVKFHDGSVLEPEDVRYSFLRLMLSDYAGLGAPLLEPLLGEVTSRPGGKLMEDAYERASKAVRVEGGALVLKLKRPYAPLLTVLTTTALISSKKWSVAHGQWDGSSVTWKAFNNPDPRTALPNGVANGTGPFRLERFEAQSIHLTRHDEYWRGPAKLKNINIRVIPELITRKLMLEAGDADAIVAPISAYSQFENIPGVRLVVIDSLLSPILFPFPFKLNPIANPLIGSGKLDGHGIPPDFFSDIDTRRGFAYSIDQETFIRDVLKGRGKPAAGIISKGMIGYRDGKPRYSFNPRKAEEHFRKAWKGEAWKTGFQFTLVAREGNEISNALAYMIKKNIEALNPRFKIDVLVLSWPKTLDLASHGMTPPRQAAWRSETSDPHSLIFNVYHSAGNFSTLGYANPVMDRLIEEAARATDPKRRAALYLKIQELADEDLPDALAFSGPEIRVMRAWLRGARFDVPVTDYRFYDLSKEP